MHHIPQLRTARMRLKQARCKLAPAKQNSQRARMLVWRSSLACICQPEVPRAARRLCPHTAWCNECGSSTAWPAQQCCTRPLRANRRTPPDVLQGPNTVLAWQQETYNELLAQRCKHAQLLGGIAAGCLNKQAPHSSTRDDQLPCCLNPSHPLPCTTSLTNHHHSLALCSRLTGHLPTGRTCQLRCRLLAR